MVHTEIMSNKRKMLYSAHTLLYSQVLNQSDIQGLGVLYQWYSSSSNLLI